ncbi:MAG: SCP2 sterol-binding domain-containing protein [Pseudomonadota bacterium]
MSEIATKAVAEMNAKLEGGELNKTVKFVIEDEGCFVVDAEGARVSDEDSDLTVTASAENFQGMEHGSVNPSTAYMTGSVKIDGDLSLAMTLGSILG